jgi:hypothetical protein
MSPGPLIDEKIVHVYVHSEKLKMSVHGTDGVRVNPLPRVPEF